jgi:hypothetical protein
VTGKDKDMDYQLRKDAKKCEKKAEELTKEGRKILDHNHKDAKKAEKLQEEAAEKAEKANRATEYALDQQIEGQNKLATAGRSLINFVLGKNLGEDQNFLERRSFTSGRSNDLTFQGIRTCILNRKPV